MREPVQVAVPAMEPPSEEARAEALANWGSRQAHDRYMAKWPCLNSIELGLPADPADPPVDLTIAAWNIERCKHVEASAALIERTGVDIVLATEMDHGMARSGQHHTTRDLARALGVGYLFGVEFVELGIGDVRETAKFSETPNRHGLHGNAILSRWPLTDPALIPLDDGGAWFVAAPKNDGQYRVGGRMAMAAKLHTNSGPIVLASVHLESESDAEGRTAQIDRLLATLDRLYGQAPAVIGGDLNTRGFLEAGLSAEETLRLPETAEPCFAAFARHGLDWRACNTGHVTTRHPPWATERFQLKTLDWLFVRGLSASEPRVIPALSAEGAYLSDHEMVLARFAQ